MTNVTAGAYADMPLFLFHLLEYMDVPYEIDVADINRRWALSAGDDVWSQIIIKETHPEVELLTAAPKTGVWKLDDRGRDLVRALGQRLAQPDRRDRGVLPERRHARASTATRARTSASWSRAGGWGPTTTSRPSAAGSGSTPSRRSSPAPRWLPASRPGGRRRSRSSSNMTSSACYFGRNDLAEHR